MPRGVLSRLPANGRSRAAALVAVAIATPIAFSVGACADGATPDCSDAETPCGPSIDGSTDGALDAVSNATNDGSTDASEGDARGASEAAVDVDASGRGDGSVDGSSPGDAGSPG